jgi:hypothetical protein
MESARRRSEAAMEQCRADIDAHCPKVEPGEGGLVRCLREHESDLSEGCRTAMRGPGPRPAGPPAPAQKGASPEEPPAEGEKPPAD